MAVWYKHSGPWWDQSALAMGNSVSLPEDEGRPDSLFAFYRALLAVCRAHPELINGTQVLMDNVSPHVFSFDRGAGAAMSGPWSSELASVRLTEQPAGRVELTLPAYGVGVFSNSPPTEASFHAPPLRAAHFLRSAIQRGRARFHLVRQCVQRRRGTGRTVPGRCAPFGLVQPGPDNRDTGWAYTSGYQYSDPHIRGFSQTQLSGTGLPELGDVLLLPAAGVLAEKTGTGYDKVTEQGTPGYYAVTLDDDVRVKLTRSADVALHRYAFPGSDAAVFVDCQHGLRFDANKPSVLASDVQVEDASTLSGEVSTANWVTRTFFFTLRFDRPALRIVKLRARPGDLAPRYARTFQLGPDHALQAKIARSSFSVAGANANLQAEQPDLEFVQVRVAADPYRARVPGGQRGAGGHGQGGRPDRARLGLRQLRRVGVRRPGGSPVRP